MEAEKMLHIAKTSLNMLQTVEDAELKNIPIGTYEVYEGDILRYVKQATKSVTVTDGNTANVTFKNELKKGNIEIRKDSDDKIVKDFTFKVTGSDGSTYTATTNANSE